VKIEKNSSYSVIFSLMLKIPIFIIGVINMNID